MVYIGMWIVAIGLAARALHFTWRLPRRTPDRADRIAALIFGVATIALPVGALLLLGSRAPAWLWPLVALATTGLSISTFKAAKGSAERIGDEIVL